MLVCILMRMRDYKSVTLGGWGSGEDLGVLGEGEIVIRIHCMKKNYFKNELSIFLQVFTNLEDCHSHLMRLLVSTVLRIS